MKINYLFAIFCFISAEVVTDLVNYNICNSDKFNEDYIYELDEYFFKGCDNIQQIIYISKGIQKLHTNVFKNVSEVNIINLNKNKINILRNNLFVNLSKLTTIRLMENEINFVEQGCFENLPSIVIIDLSYNKLKTLQTNIIDDINIFKNNIALHDNPWDCNMALCPILNLFSQSKHFKPKCSNFNWKKWNEVASIITPEISVSRSEICRGDEVVLQCTACVPSYIFWKFNNGPIIENHGVRQRNLTSILTISNIQYSGAYSCGIKNCLTCTGVQYLNLKDNFIDTTITENIKQTDNMIESGEFYEEYADINKDLQESFHKYEQKQKDSIGIIKINIPQEKKSEKSYYSYVIPAIFFIVIVQITIIGFIMLINKYPSLNKNYYNM